MILPPGFTGVAFGTAKEGDARTDESARTAFVTKGVPQAWAFATQVHGARVIVADRPGNLGEADAIVTERPGLAVTVATADCVPIAVVGDGFAAVIHAGWRGLAAGVVPATLATIARRGHVPEQAAVGPAIGPCCYEVGDEVAGQFPDQHNLTTWGTTSVDLAAVVRAQLGDLVTWASHRCTMTDVELHSFRRNRTKLRQVAVAWLPTA